MNWNFSWVNGPNFKSKLIFEKFRTYLNLTLTSMVKANYLKYKYRKLLLNVKDLYFCIWLKQKVLDFTKLLILEVSKNTLRFLWNS